MKFRANLAVKCLMLSVVALGLLAASSFGAAPATYIVKYVNSPPSGPTDAAWNQANVFPAYTLPPGTADFNAECRYLWDGTYLYTRAMVTDNMHVLNTTFQGASAGVYGDMGNYYNWDIVEFYVNAVNNTTGAVHFPIAGCTQDAWGIDQNGNAFRSNSGFVNDPTPSFAVANANVVIWKDANFDPTGTVNTVNGGNYGLQIRWAWTATGSLAGFGATPTAGLGLSSTPTSGQLMRLGWGANDDDTLGAGATHNQAFSSNFSGSGNINGAWDTPSTYGPAQVVGPNPTVVSATPIDQTHVNVLFALTSTASAMDLITTQNATKYILDNGASVSTAVLQADGVTVQLTTAAPMTANTTFHLTVTGVQDARANLIAPNPTTVTFAIPGAPTLSATTTTVDQAHLTVKFTLPVSAATASNVTNYSLSGGLAVASATVATSTSVTLAISPMTPNSTYTLSVSNVVSAFGITISPNPSTATIVFGGPTTGDLVKWTFPTTVAINTLTSSTYDPTTINAAIANTSSDTAGLHIAPGAGYTARLRTDNTTMNAPMSQPTLYVGGLTETTLSAAFTANSYIEFTVKPASGYTINFSTMEWDESLGSAGTPRGIAIETSKAGFSATNSVFWYQGTGNRPASTHASWDMSATGSFNSQTAATTYRFYLLHSSGGDHYIDNLVIRGSAVAPAVAPTISSLTCTNPSQVQVLFSTNIDPVTGQTLANYGLANSLETVVGISAATLGADNKTVTLTTSGLSVGNTYTLTVNNVKSWDNLAIASPSTAVLPIPVPTSPTITSVTVPADTTHVTVAYSRAMNMASTALAANYTSDSLAISAATSATASSVTLTVSPAMTSGSTYNLTVNNVQDTQTPFAGTIVSPTATQIVMPTPTVPTVVSASASTDITHISIGFSEAMSAQSAANYALDNGISVVSVSVTGSVATLTTSTMPYATLVSVTVNNVQDAELPIHGVMTTPTTTTVMTVNPPPPTITSASATNLTSVQVAYSVPMDAVTTTTATNYAINGLTVSSVSQVTSSTYLLTVSTMAAGTSYTVTVNHVLSTPYNVAIAANAAKGFTTPVGPVLSGAAPGGLTWVNLTFNKAVDAVSAGNAGNFRISGGGTISGATVVNSTSVQLAVSTLTSGTAYTLTALNIADGVVPGLVTASSTAALTTGLTPYQVKFTAAAPSGPADSAWALANVVPSNWTDGGSVTGTDLNMDVRFMWDATNLYVRVMVTDNMHYNVTAPGLNAYNNDSLEFYINAHDNAAGGFTNYSTQDQFYIMANGALGGAAGNIGSTTAQVVAWTDPTFDPTGTNQVNGGNYGLMVTYKWVGTAGGQLGFTTAPAAGATMRLGAGANDADITFARHAHAISQSYTGTGALTYNNQSTWYSSMLVATNNSPTVAITSPTSPSSVGLGATVNLTAQAAVGNPGDTIAGVQFFDGGVAIGAGIHTTDGIYTFGWNTTGASVGLHNITAVVTDSAARTAASAPATVVNVIGAPTISITAPTSPYQAYAPANVNLVASVNNPGGTITGVTFYDGGLFLAAATNPNDGIWTFGWATVPVGTHSVTAVVTNNFGLTGTSAAVSIEIDPTAPTIAMTASPTQAYAPADVVLTASATNGAPGTVTGVSFFDGTASHVATFDAGTGTWTFGWATVPVGTYSVVAVATDNGGLSATSAAVSVEIDSLIAPTVAITSPASGMIAGQGWKIVLTASTADGTPGTVTGVAMYDGAVKLGDAVLAAGVWTYTWDTSAASVTGHSITAVATDSMGLTATSAPVAIAMRLGGDGNNDGIVDGEDYGVWQAGYGHGTSFATGDYNGDGVVDGEDYGAWQSDYGRTSGLDDIVAASTADQAMAVATMASAPRITATMPASGSTAAGVTTVTLTFDSNVLVGGAAVEVSGLATGKQAATAVYDAATKTLTLTFASALPADAYTVRVIGSFVVGADDGAALDGAGTGTAGSDAQLQFTAE